MKPPVPYVYRVQPCRKRGKWRWELAVVPPRGRPNVLTTYAAPRLALSAARLLAGSAGTVEVTA